MSRKNSNRIGKMIRQKRAKGKNGENRDTAVVRIRVNGEVKSFYLGKWGSREAEEEYRRLAREYYSETKEPIPLSKEPRLYDVYQQFTQELDSKNDESDKRCYISAIWYAMQILPNIPCKELEIKHLIAYQDYLVRIANDTCKEERGVDGRLIQRKKGIWTRQNVNRLFKFHKTILKFGANKGLIPYGFLYALQNVKAVMQQPSLKETEAVQAVADEDVLKTLPFMDAQTADMVLLIRGAVMRPVECCRLRLCDLDTSGDCWSGHVKGKTDWRGYNRFIAFSKQETEILKKWSAGKKPEEYIFSPPGENRMWQVTHLGRHVKKAIELANKACMGVKPWTLYQLRHTGYTSNAAQYGAETASKIAGNHLDMARIYDHSARRIAVEKAEERGAWWE